MLIEKLQLQQPLSNWELPNPKAEAWRYYQHAAKQLQGKNLSAGENIAEISAALKAHLQGAGLQDCPCFFWGDDAPNIAGIQWLKTSRQNMTVLEHSPFARLNQSLAEDALMGRITQKLDAPLIFAYGAQAEAEAKSANDLPAIQPALYLHLAENTEMTLIEIVAGGHFTNSHIHIELDAGARFNHYVISDFITASPHHIGNLSVECKAGAHYQHFSFWRDLPRDACIRRDGDIRLNGAGAHAGFYSLGNLAGDNQLDNVTLIKHLTADTTANEEVRHLIDARAVANFQGKIIVCPDAQQTEGYQMSRSLLLSDNGRANHKPELEIYADDVKCSHGSTIGAPDRNQLFYLQTRGFEKSLALKLICQAFLSELILQIDNENCQKLFTLLNQSEGE